ncbi:DUF2780 domain-containing protein [Methylomonas rhizoryzae]|uniref:DUF2780 domain-containing protein n=1 Tax=Methylomonas rhizoryzae TaxID=2608981 RepID=UPI001231F0B6|nr:DUF2780 domain-containing protein [Methylomonas rhizoryzae]
MKTISTVSSICVAGLLAGCAQTPSGAGQVLAQAAAQQAVGTLTGSSSQLGLVTLLVDKLGVNPQQALGGAGSIFALAQQYMNPSDFTQLSGSIPGMDQYLGAVPQSSGSNVLLGSAATLLGGQNSGLGKLAALGGSFQSLGMNANMASQFVPVVLQYVQGQGGSGAMSLLQRALY